MTTATAGIDPDIMAKVAELDAMGPDGKAALIEKAASEAEAAGDSKRASILRLMGKRMTGETDTSVPRVRVVPGAIPLLPSPASQQNNPAVKGSVPTSGGVDVLRHLLDVRQGLLELQAKHVELLRAHSDLHRAHSELRASINTIHNNHVQTHALVSELHAAWTKPTTT